MKKLKIILQSNGIYYFSIILIILYILIYSSITNYKYNKISLDNYFEGRVINLSIKNNKVIMILKNKIKVKASYIKDESDNNDYYELIGKKIIINGNLNETNNNTIPNTFNYKDYLFHNHIYGVYNIDNFKIINNENFLYHLKYLINKRINGFEEKIIPYLNIFLLGDKSLLQDDILNNYHTNGIWHLFAISGMHIELFIKVFSKIIKRIKLKKLIIICFLLFFLFITNFSPSTQRVCIFYFLKNFLNHFKIQISNIKILLITAFVIIIINPFVIYNSGFQYSFLITLGIMLYSYKIKGNYLKKTYKISLIALLISLPISINNNYEINILSLFSNLLYVPFITFIIFPLTILCIIFKFLTPIYLIVISCLEISNEYLSYLKINIIIPRMSLSIIIIYYLLLFIYYKTKVKTIILFVVFLTFFNILLSKLDKSFKVYYFDVNQGDSSILISPFNRETIMIDTGGNIFNNYGSNNIIIFLKSLGINKIDSLIITHGDFDHMGWSINLVNNFKVEKVIFNCGPYNDLEKDLIKVLNRKKIPYYSCIKELKIDNNKLYFLQTKEYDNENDNSNVIYTELDGYKFMFMGDAGVTTEKEIMDKYDLQDIDILKVGHHGSRTSSSEAFINKINSKYSIISVGKNNRYGHPNKEVLDNLKKSKIYRTDQDGSVMFKIRNNNLKIETCTP